MNYNWTKAEKWIAAHPRAPWSEFKEAVPKFPLSDKTYYSRTAKILGKSPLGKGNKKNGFDWTQHDKWIEQNPDVSFSGFKTAFPDYPYSDGTYYNRKAKLLNGGKKTQSSASAIRKSYYTTLVAIPKAEVSDEELKGMNRMLELLHKQSIKLELVQRINPDIIEIRQFQARLT